MRRIFIQQIIFLFLVCIPIKANKDVVNIIIPYAGFAASYNWACTCKYYWNIIKPNDSLLKKFSDIVKKMDIDTYTKEMICLARSENKNMFCWLKDNTNEENRKESDYILKLFSRYNRENLDLMIYQNKNHIVEFDMQFRARDNGINICPFIRLLIHQGFDINQQWIKGSVNNPKWENGDTLLHFLAYGDNTNCEFSIYFLFNQLGINVNIQNNKGQTPLHIMICDKRKKQSIPEVNNYESHLQSWQEEQFYRAQLLLNRPEILINIKDENGNTPLDLAMIYENDEMYEYLYKRPDIKFNLVTYIFIKIKIFIEKHDYLMSALIILIGISIRLY